MTPEQKQFVEEYKLKKSAFGDDSYYVKYKGFHCVAFIKPFNSIEIRPISKSYDIGSGAGESVHIKFTNN